MDVLDFKLDLSPLLEKLLAFQLTKYSWVAATAAFVYDYMSTIEKEVIVWRRRWSLGKTLYLLIRYTGVIAVIVDVTVLCHTGLGNKFCEGFAWWLAASNAFSVLIVQIALTIRIYVVYGRKKMMVFFLGILLAAGAISALVIYKFSNVTAQAVGFGLSGCQTPALSPLFGYIMLPGLITETVLCVLMLFKGLEAYRARFKSELFETIMKDSFFYFAGTFTILLANSLLFHLLKVPSYDGIGLLWVVVLCSSMGCRLLVQKGAGYDSGSVQQSIVRR